MITLRTMTDGLPHPNARQQVITTGVPFASPEWWGELYINSSRLGVVFRPVDPDDNRFSVIVWNWRTGELVLVREFHCVSAPRVDTDHLSRPAP